MKTALANWNGAAWWVGAAIGAFVGGLILVHGHGSSVGILRTPPSSADQCGAAAAIALAQILCLLAAYGVWKCCAPRRKPARSFNG